MNLKDFLEGYRCTNRLMDIFNDKKVDNITENFEKYESLSENIEKNFPKFLGYFSGRLINGVLHPVITAKIMTYKAK